MVPMHVRQAAPPRTVQCRLQDLTTLLLGTPIVLGRALLQCPDQFLGQISDYKLCHVTLPAVANASNDGGAWWMSCVDVHPEMSHLARYLSQKADPRVRPRTATRTSATGQINGSVLLEKPGAIVGETQHSIHQST